MKRKHFVFGVLAMGAATPVFAQCTLTALASFNGSNGATPESDLVADAAGNLYGQPTRAVISRSYRQQTVHRVSVQSSS